MPLRGKAWWHVQIGTYCAWLPGDKRGFRTRDHRIHSSGNYRSPPPPDEHEGLREYHENRSPGPVKIRRELRLRIAARLAESLLRRGHRVLVVSVGEKHAHAVAELPLDERCYNRELGRAKSDASRCVRKELPGRIWARDDRHDMLRDRPYQHNAVRYVRNKQGPTAAVWCYDGLRREATR